MTRNANSNGHKTETPDVSHIRNVEVEHEASDVSVAGVATFVAILTIATIVISIGMVFLFKYFDAQAAKERQPGPMALSDKERLPPEPRLQAAPGFAVTLEDGQRINLQNKEPQAEYRVLRAEWEKELRGELKDQSGNLVAIPIDQAIDQVVSGAGLPTRAQTAPGKLTDYAISMPTAWSSARETGKKLQ
ncbi:MAG TPA: hypothetical protein VN844_10155 [Pyrinomonadaceae bacterium]|nr:hypothetical protein [Pyrinomonadaceae bacterium]